MSDPDYVHNLARACQRFVGAVAVIEPDAFVAAIAQLVADMPRPEGAAQGVWLWTSVSAAAIRGASAYHRFFHKFFSGSCRFVPPWLESTDVLSNEAVAQRLMHWAQSYARSFDAEHAWPVAVKAATAIRQHPPSTRYAGDLARSVGTSCSTLERSFKTIYGTTPQHYHRLVRLRRTIETLRTDPGSLEGIALEVGWPSVKNAHRAMRRSTALTLSAARRLSSDEFGSLMDGALALPLPRQSRAHKLT